MKVFALALTLLSSVAFADNHEPFDQAKASAMSNIDKRIENLRSAKSCISAAQDKAALQKCRDNMKSANSELRAVQRERKEMRQKMRAEKRGKKSE